MKEKVYLAISETIQHSNQEPLKSRTWHIAIKMDGSLRQTQKCTPLYDEPEMSWM